MDLVSVTYETVAASLMGTTADVSTVLDFENGVLGGPPTIGGINTLNLGPAFFAVFTVDNTLNLVPDRPFIRGDADGTGFVAGLLDGLFILNFAFNGGPPPPCMRAADADGNGSFNGLIDSLYLLDFFFSGSMLPPPAPYPGCGTAPDGLTCDVSPPTC